MTTPIPDEQGFSKRERSITLVALSLVFLLAALDQTIVATAMPRIVGELKGLNLYAWVTTAYMLASTVTVPIAGKVSDIFGRKRILVISILLFMIGSMLCGMAGSFGSLLGGGMMQLIVFRVIQGVGGAGLITGAYTVVADLYSPRERGKVTGLFGSMLALASVGGPVIGGLLTDYGNMQIGSLAISGWRWVFYVNLPISLVSLGLIAAKMPRLTHQLQPGKLDWAGTVLIIMAVVPGLLALSWGGQSYAWASPPILGLLSCSIASLMLFLWVETVSPNPILSLALFRNRVFTTVNLASVVFAMAFMGTLIFLPLYIQLGQGVAAAMSGVAMLAMMLGLLVSSTISGQIVSRTGEYKPAMLAGSAIMVLGLFLVSRVGAQTTTIDLCWRAMVVGIGIGPSMSTFNVAVQNAFPRHQLGVATAATQFFRQIGSTVGVALFGALLAHNLSAELARPRAGTAMDAPRPSLGDIQRLAQGHSAQISVGHSEKAPSPVDIETRLALSRALASAFQVSGALAALSFFLLLLVPARRLGETSPEETPESPSTKVPPPVPG